MQKFRPAAVPLVNSDPYFSVWSMADHLYDDFTRHWTGKRQAMTGLMEIDGVLFRFMGKVAVDSNWYETEPVPMEQVSVTAGALTTDYIFRASGVELRLTFMSPLFMDDLKLLSRPCCFVKFHVSSIDGGEHKTKIWFDASGELCLHETDKEVVLGRNENDIFEELTIGTAEQNILGRKGDTLCIDWGYLHLVAGKNDGFHVFTWNHNARRDFFHWTEEDKQRYSFLCWFFPDDGKYEEGKPYRFDETFPMLAASGNADVKPGEEKDLKLCLMYDDIKCIDYFGTQLDAYWRKDGETFEDIAKDSVERFDEYLARARAFDRELYAEACACGGREYADIVSLVYRQAVNAHKLTMDEKGDVLFFSKECNSNGCCATVDVSYPSSPIFLRYNPELVFGMMRPVMRFAKSDAWPHNFAPHDVGTYPLAVGQVYSGTSLDGQMPIEECGNMILMTATATIASGDMSFLKENFDILNIWCDYLVNNAQDPANQLCTDDFTGHLAHNANLSIKGILAIGAFGHLCGMLGDTAKKDTLIAKAREMAAEWKKLAFDGDHYRLAYDQPGTWSLKYNLVWDKVMGLNIFDRDITETETAYYQTKLNRYGIPLDSRADFTKVDFLMWAAVLKDDMSYFASITESVWRMANETSDRYAFTDWYFTSNAKFVGFINRSVVGGMFLKMLDASGRVKIKE